MKIKIGKKIIGDGQPVYIIAEIGSNFDGNIGRAKRLIDLVKDSGADCAKFQFFKTDKIICAKCFGKKSSSFQRNWKKSVYEVYKDAEFRREWSKELARYCRLKGIDFSSSPYDIEGVDMLDELGVPFIKIGSGDITFPQILRHVAKKNRPVVIGVGASTIQEIKEAVGIIRKEGNKDIVLLQCVTNYPCPFEDANIKAMQFLRERFNVLVGYSDHTNDPGYVVPLGAVALGASVIEKHFTDDRKRPGPDHSFAMDHVRFKQMARDIRLLEKALGNKEKRVYPSESETVILQRRCIHAVRDLKKGKAIEKADIEILRPAPQNGILPRFLDKILGKRLRRDLTEGDVLTWKDVEV
jgi:N-acetylneuraminate synthase